MAGDGITIDTVGIAAGDSRTAWRATSRAAYRRKSQALSIPTKRRNLLLVVNREYHGDIESSRDLFGAVFGMA
jgi:hypothetical protein